MRPSYLVVSYCWFQTMPSHTNTTHTVLSQPLWLHRFSVPFRTNLQYPAVVNHALCVLCVAAVVVVVVAIHGKGRDTLASCSVLERCRYRLRFIWHSRPTGSSTVFSVALLVDCSHIICTLSSTRTYSAIMRIIWLGDKLANNDGLFAINVVTF